MVAELVRAARLDAEKRGKHRSWRPLDERWVRLVRGGLVLSIVLRVVAAVAGYWVPAAMTVVMVLLRLRGLRPEHRRQVFGRGG